MKNDINFDGNEKKTINAKFSVIKFNYYPYQKIDKLFAENTQNKSWKGEKSKAAFLTNYKDVNGNFLDMRTGEGYIFCRQIRIRMM